MIRTLHRSILREIAVTFAIIVVSLNFVLMMEKIFRLSRFLSEVGASFADILRIILLIQPQILVLTLPMSFLLSVLVTYSRMTMDSEIVVMRAVGMSMRQISLPAAFVGVVAFLLTGAMTFFFSPHSATKVREMVNSILQTRGPLSLDEGIFHSAFKGVTLLVGRKPAQDEFQDIFIYDSRRPTRPMVIVARNGRILMSEDGAPSFDIRDGHVSIMGDDGFTDMHFKKYVMQFDTGTDFLAERKKEKTPGELLRDALTSEGKERRSLLLELHRRLTLALINLSIIFLAPALAIRSGKRGRLSGFIAGVGVFSGYYSLLIYFENLVRAGALPAVSAWIPLIALSVLSLALYRREARR